MSDTFIAERGLKQSFLQKIKSKDKGSISTEDFELITALEDLRCELNNLHNCLDNITDETLIDSYIFEIQAVNIRYKFYLNKCKEKGIIANFI